VNILPAPPTPPRPAAPVDDRQLVADTLIRIACRLDTRKPPADSLLEQHAAGLPDQVAIALIAASWADSEQTAALLDDLASANTRLDRHRATIGHDECCTGDCECVVARHLWRCRACEDGPADTLWEAQNDLLHRLEMLRSLPHLLRAAQDTT